MTVSTISQEDIASDFGKRHNTRYDKDHDNDRTLSDLHEREHSYRSAIGITELNTEDNTMTRRNVPQAKRRSSSPSYIERSEPSKVFDYDPDDSNDNDNNDSNSNGLKRRSNSFDDKHQSSSDYNNGRHWDQEGERPSMYPRSTRSSIENQKAHDKHNVRKERHGDQDSHRTQEENDGEKNSPSRSIDEEMHDDMMSDDDDQLEDDEYDENEESPGSRDDGSNAKNDDGSDSTALSAGGVRKPVKVRSMFVDKLYRMVEDPSIQHLISWAKEGDMFYVYNCIKLSDDVLPKFFKHNNWQSFVRQLNMYGFHKIYRYDREESNLNRKNPETQRWQFYHPHFQRDLPHLRKSIKRKSARNTISAPSTSRIIFEHEHGRGFFLQRDDRSRSNSGEGAPSQSQSLSRGLDGKPTPKLSPGHQHQVPHSPYSHQQPSTMHPKAGPRPPSNAQNQREPEHRELTIQHHRDSRSHYLYPNQQQDAHRGGHQRQNTYPNTHSYPNHIHSPDRAYDHNAPRSPMMTHDPHHPRPPPPPSPYLSGDAATPGYRSVRSILPGHYSGSENGPESPHGAAAAAAAAASHLRSQSVPGIIDHRKSSMQSRGSDLSNSPIGHHPDAPHSPGHQLQRSHGSIGDAASTEQSPRGPPPPHHPHHLHPSYNDPHRQDRLPSMGGDVAHKDSSQPPTPSLPSGNKLEAPPTPVAPPTPHAAPQVMSPPGRGYFSQGNLPLSSPTSPHQGDRVVRELEARLHAMEDAYMALQQHTHKLQQSQASQDRTIQWMRERIDFMTDSAHAHRGPALSPSIHPSKRKAEPIPDDVRGRPRFEPMPRHESGMGFGVDGPPDQHHAHGHGHGYSRGGGGGGPSPAGPGFLPGEGHPNGSYHEQPSPALSGQPQPLHPQHHPHESQHPQQQRPHHSMPAHLHQQQQQQMQAQGSHNRQYRPHPSSGKPY
ncbi:hypothetical protein BGX26_002010 [Mortierella sp. AD094]|nr:hypothetical protein BGX26_002010 [Mortierella sp. AD094]